MDRTLFPNTTPFPNFLTDEILPLLTGDEWKVVHYGVVHALRCGDEPVTLAQFAHGHQREDGTTLDRGTGLSEDQVRVCLEFLCDQLQLFLRQDRPRKPMAYRVNPDMTSVHWELLEARRREQPATRPATDSSGLPRPPARPRFADSSKAFPERPSVEISLSDASDQPLVNRLCQALPPAEAAAFRHLSRLYAGDQHELADDEAWALYRLWQTYGFTHVVNTLQDNGPVENLADLGLACLAKELARLLEEERFGPITPQLRDEIKKLAAEYPNLEEWQGAIRTAVRINRRRLSTVETILKNQRQRMLTETKRPAGRRERRATTAPRLPTPESAHDEPAS